MTKPASLCRKRSWSSWCRSTFTTIAILSFTSPRCGAKTSEKRTIMFSCTNSMPCNLPVRCGFGTVSSWCVNCLSIVLFFLACLWSAACKQNSGASSCRASLCALSTMLRAMFSQYMPTTWPCLKKSGLQFLFAIFYFAFSLTHSFWPSCNKSPDILFDLSCDILQLLLWHTLSATTTNPCHHRWGSGTPHWTRIIAVGVRHTALNSRDRSWGPARHTELAGSQVGPGTPHCTRRITVGVQHATLNSQHRGWGPARHTELIRSRLGPSTPHWTQRIPVEEDDRRRRRRTRRRTRRRRRRDWHKI